MKTFLHSGRLAVSIGLLTTVLAAAQASPDVLGEERERPELVFFGVVTVRDGRYVLFQNPDLEGDALERAQRQLLESGLGGSLDLADKNAPLSDRVLVRLRVGTQYIEPKVGDPGHGLVPHRLYLVSSAESVSLDDREFDPKPQRALQMSRVKGCVEVRWSTKDEIDSFSFSTAYWFDTDCEVTARLQKAQLVVGAAGRTMFGVKWRINNLIEEADRVTVGLEAGPSPQSKRLFLRLRSAEGEAIPCGGRSVSESSDPNTEVTTYDFGFTLTDDAHAPLGMIDICAPYPDRVKRLAVRAFSLVPEDEKADAEDAAPDEQEDKED